MLHVTKQIFSPTTFLYVRHNPKSHGSMGIPTLYLEVIRTKIQHFIGHVFLKDDTNDLILTLLEEIQILTGTTNKFWTYKRK